MINPRVKVVVGIALIVMAGLGVFLWQTTSRPDSAPAPLASSSVVKNVTHESPPMSSADGEVSARVQELERRLAEEHRARESAEADNKDLRTRLAPLENNVVVSYGKIEDIGKRTAALLSFSNELSELSKRSPGSLSEDEKRRLLDLQRQQADVLGMLPEIAGFQDDPKEYGRFFRGMLQQSANLDEGQAAQVESYMTQRGQVMVQEGLNAARKPADPALADPWETQRDKFNEQTASGLTSMLPPGAAASAGFSDNLMEFLEMDFPNANPGTPTQR